MSGASAARARGKAEQLHAQRQGDAELEAAFDEAEQVLEEADEKFYEDRLTRAASGVFEGSEGYEGTSAQVIDESNLARAEEFANEIKDRGRAMKKMYEQRGRGLRSVGRAESASKIIGGVADIGSRLASHKWGGGDETRKSPKPKAPANIGVPLPEVTSRR